MVIVMRKVVLYCDDKYNAHISSNNYEENGYRHDLDSVKILH